MVRMLERRPEGYSVKTRVRIMSFQQRAFENSIATECAGRRRGCSRAGLNSETTPACRVERSQEEARSAADVEYFPARQPASIHKCCLFALRAFDPINLRIGFAPIFVRVKPTELRLVHLGKRPPDPAVLAPDNYELIVRVAKTISC